MTTNLPLLLAALILALLPLACSGGERRPAESRPAHHAETGFRNPHLVESRRGVFRYLRMKYFGDEEFADDPAEIERIPRVPADREAIHRPGTAPQVTWIGHATFLIQYRNTTILTDPVFSDRASPVSFAGPKRVLPPALAIDELPPVDIVLVSHNHYDHLDTATVRALGDRVQWRVPLGIRDWMIRKGIAPNRVREFDWWNSERLGETEITAAPMQHWSARGFGDRNRTLWVSWAVEIGDFSLWFCGDTGYNAIQFLDIGERFGGFDLAIIPIGAYAPRWFMKDAHVTPEEAATIHDEIRSRFSVAHHWGAFRLSAEPLDEPPRRLAEAMRDRGEGAAPFVSMAVGETRILAPNP